METVNAKQSLLDSGAEDKDFANDDVLTKMDRASDARILMIPLEQTKNGEKTKRTDIQSLRGVAIIYVLLFHLFPKTFPKGFLGVDIFFIISGYLITMILSKNKPISLMETAKFFSKRIRRIFPAYYLMVFIVIVFEWIFLTPNDREVLNADSLWTLGFASNVHKYIQKKDYFAQIGNYDFLLHTWSLAVEMQFYCFAPLLVAMSHRMPGGRLALMAIAGASAVFHLSTHGELRFSSMPSRLWQFMTGGLAFALTPKCKGSNCKSVNRCTNSAGQDVFRLVRQVLVDGVALLAIAVVACVIALPTGHEAMWRFAVTFAASVIVARPSPSVNDFFLRGSYLLLVGDISYSLYLAHWPVIVFFKYCLITNSLPFAYSLLAAQLAVLIGYVSFHAIEKYFIRENLLRSTVLILCVVMFSLSMMTSSQTMSIAIQRTADQTDVNTTSQTLSVGGNESLGLTRFQQDCRNFHNVDYLPLNLTPKLIESGTNVNSIRFMHSWPSNIPKDTLPDSLFQKHFTSKGFSIPYFSFHKGPGEAKVVVIGNSFARRALPAIRAAFGARLGEIRLLGETGCPPFIGTTYEGVLCLRFQKAAVELIRELKPHFTFLVFRPVDPIDSPLVNISSDVELGKIQRTIDMLSPSTSRIVLEYPLPVDKDKFYTPFLLQHLRQADVSLRDVKLDYSVYWNRMKHIYKRMDSIKCVNCDRIYPHEIFCDYKVCRVFDPDNLFSFFDDQLHFNQYAIACVQKVYEDYVEKSFANGVVQ